MCLWCKGGSSKRERAGAEKGTGMRSAECAEAKQHGLRIHEVPFLVYWGNGTRMHRRKPAMGKKTDARLFGRMRRERGRFFSGENLAQRSKAGLNSRERNGIPEAEMPLAMGPEDGAGDCGDVRPVKQQGGGFAAGGGKAAHVRAGRAR